jgi:hypothetical protein
LQIKDRIKAEGAGEDARIEFRNPAKRRSGIVWCDGLN